jgi:hypothetical protein
VPQFVSSPFACSTRAVSARQALALDLARLFRQFVCLLLDDAGLFIALARQCYDFILESIALGFERFSPGR